MAGHLHPPIVAMSRRLKRGEARSGRAELPDRMVGSGIEATIRTDGMCPEFMTSYQKEKVAMFDPNLLLPFANARQERFMREADEWRLIRSLEAQSPRWYAFRRAAGQILITAGGHIGDVSLDDCLPRRHQTV